MSMARSILERAANVTLSTPSVVAATPIVQVERRHKTPGFVRHRRPVRSGVSRAVGAIHGDRSHDGILG